MIGWYYKYRIRYAIEQRTELPGWLQRKTNDDRELLRYAEDYARLTQQLSSGAANWMQSEMREQRPDWSAEVASMLQLEGDKTRNTVRQPELNPSANGLSRFQNSTSLRWGVSIAATILFVFGLLAMRKHALQTAAHQESIQKSQMAVTVTTAMLQKSQSVADQSIHAYERTLHKVSRKMVDGLGDSAIAPIESGGRWLGVVMNEFHSGAIREQNQLIEMSKRFRSRFEK